MLKKLFPKLACLIADFLRFSWRVRYSGIENLQQARKHHPAGGLIFVVWHENALGSVLTHAGNPFYFLISRSRDGDFVEAISRHLGYHTIRGSSSRGGAEAKVQLKSVLEEGYATAITIDGPRGPRHQCKMGALDLALQTGAAILPIAGVSQNPFIFKKSWDQFKLILPFSRVVHRYGKILTVEKDKILSLEEREKYLQKIKEAINLTVEEAQQKFNEFSQLEKKTPRWKVEIKK